MSTLTDTTPTIYCTRTNRLIDTCLPGQDSAEVKLARHMEHYGPDLVVLTFAEAWERHEAAAKSEPVEIAENIWNDALNVLPPVSWHRTSDGESFKMSERLTGAITGIYVQLMGRYFVFNDDIRTPHVECCHRVAMSPAFRGERSADERQADAGHRTDKGDDRDDGR